MKLMKFILTVFLLASPIICLADGGWVGSGGDSYSAMFRVVCLSIAESVQKSPLSQVPGKDYEINWQLFENACVKATIHLGVKVVGNKESWEVLRDQNNDIKTALFIKGPSQGGLKGELVLNGPKFIGELKSNLPGALVNVTHEIFKVIGISDLTNEVSSQAFLDYNQAYMAAQTRVDFKLKTLYDSTNTRLKLAKDFESTEATYTHDSTDQRIKKAKKLLNYVNQLIAELGTEIRSNETEGIALAREYDAKYEAHMDKLRAQKKQMREAMEDYADVVEDELKNVSFMNFFPSQAARTAGAAMRIAAAGMSLEPIRLKSTEMEWLEKRIKRVDEALTIETSQLNKYLVKRGDINDRLIDVEIEKL